jgi:hypothetical protein
MLYFNSQFLKVLHKLKSYFSNYKVGLKFEKLDFKIINFPII